jgi:NAD(P)-dependent dehydrogenase (short-subunit alcohol dehydrogenase family)
VRDRLLAGKVAVITGAAQGIGLRIAEVLAGDGATVILADVQAEEAHRAALSVAKSGSPVQVIRVDVALPGSPRVLVEEVINTFGRIDILVNSAGIDAPPGLEWEESDDHWSKIIDVDLSGSWWCAKAVIPHMISAHTGRIIFISSVAARLGFLGTSVAYNAAKAGLLGLTVALATQLESHSILVNAIAPGPTGSTGQPVTEQERSEYLRKFPLGFGGPEPVAQACLYLARPSGDWISGSVLNVSGGNWKG